VKIDTFFAELKRRNVYKVAVAYAVVGWLVIQISSTVLPTFHAPEWILQRLGVPGLTKRVRSVTTMRHTVADS